MFGVNIQHLAHLHQSGQDSTRRHTSGFGKNYERCKAIPKRHSPSAVQRYWFLYEPAFLYPRPRRSSSSAGDIQRSLSTFSASSGNTNAGLLAWLGFFFLFSRTTHVLPLRSAAALAKALEPRLLLLELLARGSATAAAPPLASLAFFAFGLLLSFHLLERSLHCLAFDRRYRLS